MRLTICISVPYFKLWGTCPPVLPWSTPRMTTAMSYLLRMTLTHPDCVNSRAFPSRCVDTQWCSSPFHYTGLRPARCDHSPHRSCYRSFVRRICSLTTTRHYCKQNLIARIGVYDTINYKRWQLYVLPPAVASVILRFKHDAHNALSHQISALRTWALASALTAGYYSSLWGPQSPRRKEGRSKSRWNHSGRLNKYPQVCSWYTNSVLSCKEVSIRVCPIMAGIHNATHICPDKW